MYTFIVILTRSYTIQMVTGVRSSLKILSSKFVICCLASRSKIEGNILRTEGIKFSTMINTPVTICFVIP